MRIILAVLMCGWVASAFADEPAGKVTFVEGIADVLRSDGNSAALREGQPVALKDKIRTKSHSKVQVTLADKSVLKLAPSSCVSIEEFRMAPSGIRERCVILITRGKAQATVAKTGAPETFVIETPNARGAVKGSDIFVSYLAGETGMFVKEGSMSVVNPAFPEVRRILKPGSCLFIHPEKPPEQPRPAMKAEMSIHRRDVEQELIKKWVPSEDSSVMNAVIVALTGEVRIHKKTAEDWSAALNGDVISEGDKLQTSGDGSAEVRLGNGNSLSVEPSTEMLFTSLRYDPQSENYHNEFEVYVGEVLAVVTKLTGESTFEVTTPTAVAGVRGTIMRVVVEPPGAGVSVPQTQIFFEGGRGDVTSLQSGSMQQLQAGQNVRVDNAGMISQPAATSFQERSVIAQDVSEKQMIGSFSGPGGPQQRKEGPGAPQLPFIGREVLIPHLPPGTEVLLPPPEPPLAPPSIWYQAPLHIENSPTAIFTRTTDFKQIALKTDGSWNAVFNGVQIGSVASGWNLRLENSSGDFVNFTGIPVALPFTGQDTRWTGTPANFSGQVLGTDVDRTLQLEQMTVATDAGTHGVRVDARGEYTPSP